MAIKEKLLYWINNFVNNFASVLQFLSPFNIWRTKVLSLIYHFSGSILSSFSHMANATPVEPTQQTLLLVLCNTSLEVEKSLLWQENSDYSCFTCCLFLNFFIIYLIVKEWLFWGLLLIDWTENCSDWTICLCWWQRKTAKCDNWQVKMNKLNWLILIFHLINGNFGQWASFIEGGAAWLMGIDNGNRA